MKYISILSILSIILTINTVQSHKYSGITGFGKEYMEIYKLTKDLDKQNKNLKGHPNVNSVLFDVVNNLLTLMREPSWEALITVMVDFASYIVMPLEGGYSAANAHKMYLQDEYAYIDAGVTETFLFVETTNLFKEKFWQFFGLFDRVEETTGIDSVGDDDLEDHEDTEEVEEEEEELTPPEDEV